MWGCESRIWPPHQFLLSCKAAVRVNSKNLVPWFSHFTFSSEQSWHWQYAHFRQGVLLGISEHRRCSDGKSPRNASDTGLCRSYLDDEDESGMNEDNDLRADLLHDCFICCGNGGSLGLNESAYCYSCNLKHQEVGGYRRPAMLFFSELKMYLLLCHPTTRLMHGRSPGECIVSFSGSGSSPIHDGTGMCHSLTALSLISHMWASFGTTLSGVLLLLQESWLIVVSSIATE